MAHGTSEPKNLSITWPFTFAGLLVTFALIYFCLGFAIHDRKPVVEEQVVEGPTSLAGHFTVFWICILAAVVISIAGYIVNYSRAKKRQAAYA